MAKNEEKDVDVKEGALVVHNTSLAGLMAHSAGTLAKVNQMIDKALENERIKNDLDMLLRTHKQMSDHQLGLMGAVRDLIEATKGKDGKIQRLTDDLVGAVESTATGAVSPAASGKRPAGRLGALGG